MSITHQAKGSALLATPFGLFVFISFLSFFYLFFFFSFFLFSFLLTFPSFLSFFLSIYPSTADMRTSVNWSI